MNEVLKKIDVEIAEHYLIINDTKRYSHSTIDYHETKVEVLEEIKEIILAEQKEPCEYCIDDVYYDVLGTPCKYNNCPICGREINQPQEGE